MGVNMAKKHRIGEIEALYFDKLPQRAKEIFFEFLSSNTINRFDMFNVMNVLDFDYSCCESPIETIFALAYDLMCFSKKTNINLQLSPQEEIIVGKTYKVDFLFDSEEVGVTGLKPFKLVIECDGHNFHSSKSQIKNDNEREMNLKLAGYDVIHFSGSQIFNEPFECANTTIDYILSKIK